MPKEVLVTGNGFILEKPSIGQKIFLIAWEGIGKTCVNLIGIKPPIIEATEFEISIRKDIQSTYNFANVTDENRACEEFGAYYPTIQDKRRYMLDRDNFN